MSNKDNEMPDLSGEDISEYNSSGSNNSNKKEQLNDSSVASADKKSKMVGIKEIVDEKWDFFTGSLFGYLKKLFSSRKVSSKYENSEQNKHNKIFSILMKYFALLVAFAFVLVLIMAFFKTYNFSREIVAHPERTESEKEISGIDFDISSSYSWETQIGEDVKRNQDSIATIHDDMKKQDKAAEENTRSIKELISQNSKDNLKEIQKSLDGTKNELFGYTDQSINALSEEMKKKIDALKKSPSVNGTFMNLPSSVVNISSKAEDFVKEVFSDSNNSESNTNATNERGDLLVKQKERETKEVIAQNDMDIYESIQIETISSDTSGYDESSNSDEDVNNTLPPVILRQGMTNGVLVTGIAAPTFEQDANPAPVSLTFKGKSIISNMFEQDVENCSAMGSVFGNIITRRAEILVNKISCTYEQDGKLYMVRANVKGWVYDGYDGRYGVPGILVDSSGAILTDSVIIGMLQGFGDFVSNTAQIYALQGTSTLNVAGGSPLYSPGQVAQTSIAGGVGEQLSSGFDTITGYYKRIIDTLYPYIDVKGGRKITIFFDGGETLTPTEYTPFLVNANHDTKSSADEYIDMEIDNDW